MNPIVCVDLDDTLMLNGYDYEEATVEFAQFTATKSQISEQKAIDVFKKIDRENVDNNGLQMERFPLSMVEAFERLVENPSEDDLEQVEQIGYNVYKTPKEYRERGFMDGAKRFLNVMSNAQVNFHLITAGDKRVQQRKIDGLELESYFNDTHITPVGTKGEQIKELVNKYNTPIQHTYHIGNSLKSDIKPTIDEGANAVYIPLHQWQSMENEEYYTTHDNVTIYESIVELCDDSPSFFTHPTKTSKVVE